MNVGMLANKLVDDHLDGLCPVCDKKDIEEIVFDELGDDCTITDYNLLLDTVLDKLDYCEICKEENLYDNDEDEYQDRNRM